MKTSKHAVRWFYNDNETHCVIKDNKGNDLATGVTTRYAKDKPDKIIGRDYAFKRAMKQSIEIESLSKSERKEIWETYRTTIKQPE